MGKTRFIPSKDQNCCFNAFTVILVKENHVMYYRSILACIRSNYDDINHTN